VLLTLADFTDLVVNASISEYDIPKLAVGQTVSMTSDGLDGVTFPGKISKIADSASTQNSTSGTETVVAVKATFDSVPQGLKPGFDLDMDITTADNSEALIVPITALQKDTATGKYNVFKVENGVLKKTPVTVGITSDMDAEIKDGLAEGDEVVTSPTSATYDGMTISGGAATGKTGTNTTGEGRESGISFGVSGGRSGGEGFSGGGAPGGGMGGRP
jgi:HlyD family secretion protein